jgi:hypothetical protein
MRPNCQTPAIGVRTNVCSPLTQAHVNRIWEFISVLREHASIVDPETTLSNSSSVNSFECVTWYEFGKIAPVEDLARQELVLKVRKSLRPQPYGLQIRKVIYG